MLFISPQMLFSFSRYLSFCLLKFWIFGRVAKRLDKIWLISNIMTSQSGQQTIVIHILFNISRSKGNHRMKFGQLIECNMRDIFLEKSYTKCEAETSPKPFSEKLKLSISQDQQSKVLHSFVLLNAKLRAIETY